MVPSFTTIDVLAGIVPLYAYSTLLTYTTPSGWFSYQGVLLKASFPMLVTLSGIVTDVRPVQPEKAAYPTLVTLSGIVTDVRPVQPEKALFPILVTLSGIVTDVRPEQPEKAAYPTLVTLSGIVTDVRPEQPEKADFPTLVTLSGITISPVAAVLHPNNCVLAALSYTK